MVALIAGTKAPPLALNDGKGNQYNLYESVKTHSLIVLAFFKVACPVCQFAFPFIQRLKENNPAATIWGISQDDLNATEAFASRYGLSFPLLLDSDLSTTVSFALTNVPTVFCVDSKLMISETIVGFDKAGLEKLNKILSRATDVATKPLFSPKDDVPSLRPG